MDSERFDPKERAREKQKSRDEDARALASGEKIPRAASAGKPSPRFRPSSLGTKSRYILAGF
jgi:hypothetical protein